MKLAKPIFSTLNSVFRQLFYTRPLLSEPMTNVYLMLALKINIELGPVRYV